MEHGGSTPVIDKMSDTSVTLVASNGTTLVVQSAEIPDIGYSDLNRGFKVWNRPEIFTGPTGTGVWCPNKDDMIIDWETGFRRVTGNDISTGLSTSIPWVLQSGSNTDVDVDVLLGVGTGKQSETWRVYIDTRQMPYSLQVDARVHLYRSDAYCYKVFLGTDINETSGEIISSYYTPSQEFQGENIPLELVATDDINNKAIWAPMAGSTNRELPDGEVVTVVLYGANGPLSHAVMLVQNTALVRRSEAGLKNVKSISIKSPYLSDSDPRLLLIPINYDVKTLVITGQVLYNTGEIVDVPITLDGMGKMSLHGLQWYTPTIQSAIMPLTLSYRLSEQEYSISHGVTENGNITEPFAIKAIAADSAYSLKLYVFPTWNKAGSRYDLDFWLFSMDRDVYYRLPRNIVETPENEAVFDGQNYTTRQRLKFGVQLDKVDPMFKEHKFVQNTEIALRQAGIEKGTKWQVKLDPTQVDFFGEGIVASNRFVNVNLSYMSVKNGCATQTQWFDKLFYGVNPLFDDNSEVKAPLPTHFVISTKGRQYEFSVSQWDQEFSILNDVTIGETVYIRWLRDTSNTRLELGVTGLAVEQSN
jgi:hypothetical protein